MNLSRTSCPAGVKRRPTGSCTLTTRPTDAPSPQRTYGLLRRWILLVISSLALVCSWQGSAHANSPQLAFELNNLIPTAVKTPKIESALSQWLAATRATTDGVAAEVPLQLINQADGIVQVVVEAVPGREAEAAAAVRGVGGRIEYIFSNLIQAMVPFAALEALAESDTVMMVRRPHHAWAYAVTEGATLSGAQAWQQAGITGSGVKVGIVDLGFEGYQALVGRELPPSSRVVYRNFSSITCTGISSCRHGTAIAEIIYDLAPDSTLYFAEARTELEIISATSWLVQQGVHVVNMSMGNAAWGPGDGTGIISQAITDAVSSGIFWVNAAGNYGQRHWAGMWSDPDGDRWMNFQGNQEWNWLTAGSQRLIPAGTFINVVLRWDDSWNGSCNDYDLYVLYLDPLIGHIIGPTIVGSSTGQQACSPAHRPMEQISGFAPLTGYYAVALRAGDVLPPSPRRVELFVRDVQLEQYVLSASISPPADTPSAFSVGAVAWNSPNDIEPYSSQGPTRDGRIKPDIVAPAGVSTASYGPQGFAGTSAAAPHVAGAAALVKQANPSWGPTQIRQFLESRAVDLGTPGKDNVFGAGRLSLGQPGTSPTPTPSPTPSPTPPPTPTAPPSPPALVSIQPHDLQRARVTWVQSQGQVVTFYRLCADFNFQFDSPFVSCRDIPISEAQGQLLVGVPSWDLGVVYYRLQACNQLGCSQQVRAGAVARRIWPSSNDWNFYMTAIDTVGFTRVAVMNVSPVPGKVSDLSVWDGLAGWGGALVNVCRNVAPGSVCGPFTFRSGSWFASASQDFPPYGQAGVGVLVRTSGG